MFARHDDDVVNAVVRFDETGDVLVIGIAINLGADVWTPVGADETRYVEYHWPYRCHPEYEYDDEKH